MEVIRNEFFTPEVRKVDIGCIPGFSWKRCQLVIFEDTLLELLPNFSRQKGKKRSWTTLSASTSGEEGDVDVLLGGSESN